MAVMHGEQISRPDRVIKQILAIGPPSPERRKPPERPAAS
jgi:hypothetical protein